MLINTKVLSIFMLLGTITFSQKKEVNFILIEKTDNFIVVKITEDKKSNLNEAKSRRIYVVKQGDTLSKISKNEEISLEEIKKLNKLKTDTIYINQKLYLQ